MRAPRPLAFIAVVFVLAGVAHAADPARPHPHRGILGPFRSAPSPTPLTDEERRAVGGGAVVLRDTAGRTDGRRAVVFTVEAPPERVWAVISRFSAFHAPSTR